MTRSTTNRWLRLRPRQSLSACHPKKHPPGQRKRKVPFRPTSVRVKLAPNARYVGPMGVGDVAEAVHVTRRAKRPNDCRRNLRRH
jgi:hypothetical protein